MWVQPRFFCSSDADPMLLLIVVKLSSFILMIFVIITDSENGDDDDYNDKEGRKRRAETLDNGRALHLYCGSLTPFVRSEQLVES